MKAVKKIILIAFFVGLGIGVSLAVIGYLFLILNKEREYSYAIDKTELNVNIPVSKEELARRDLSFPFPYTPCYKLLISNHEALPGESIVLKLARDSQGEIGVIDDEVFEKLSLELESVNVGRIEVPSGIVKLFYSRGGSAWVHHCSGQFGTEGSGYIDIKEVGENHITADISIDIKTISAYELTKGENIRVEFVGDFNKSQGYISTEFN